jgi:hypothetical protein
LPLRLLLVTLAGWVNRHQQAAIDYLVEESRILHEQLGGRRVRMNDDQPSGRTPTLIRSGLYGLPCGGLPRRALGEIQRGLVAASERNARGHRGPVLRLEAELLAHSDPIGAHDRFEEALALADELAMRPLIADCRVGLARLAQGRGRKDDAGHHLQIAITLYRDMGMTYWLEKAEAEMRSLA